MKQACDSQETILVNSIKSSPETEGGRKINQSRLMVSDELRLNTEIGLL